MKPSILIIYTGGTIGMRTDASTGVLVPFDFSGIYDEFPALRRLNVNIHRNRAIGALCYIDHDHSAGDNLAQHFAEPISCRGVTRTVGFEHNSVQSVDAQHCVKDLRADTREDLHHSHARIERRGHAQ